MTHKPRDAWWTVLLVDPMATPLVRWTARYTRVTPNQITWVAFAVGLASAACLALGDWRGLIIGALLYHLSFIFDCMDGKLARLTGQTSMFGAWLDYVLDRLRVIACAVALMSGQYQRTGDVVYVWLALVVVGLDGLHYINGLESFKLQQRMREQIKARMRQAEDSDNANDVQFMEDLLRKNPDADVEHDRRSETPKPASAADGAQPAPTPAPVIDFQREFRRRFPTFLTVRSWLFSHRIRTHLISGVEFQMGVFIIGPLIDEPLTVTLVSGALLLVFELAMTYKLLLSTRGFNKTLSSFQAPAAAVHAPAESSSPATPEAAGQNAAP